MESLYAAHQQAIHSSTWQVTDESGLMERLVGSLHPFHP